jgi:hypothetical protein
MKLSSFTGSAIEVGRITECSRVSIYLISGVGGADRDLGVLARS